MRSGFRLPELSLRVRLLVTLVVLAAIGLAALDFGSYRALHSYLYDRVDQQLESAVAPVSIALERNLEPGEVPGLPLDGEGPDGSREKKHPVPDAAGSGEDRFGPAPSSQLPPGTFGQLRRANGTVVENVLIRYGEGALPRPALPRQLEASPPGTAEPFTVGQRGGGSEQFRALAVSGPGQTTTVVAVPLGDTEATLNRLALIELVVSGAILAALAALAWWLIGVGLRPLRRMGEVAGDIAAGDLSRRVEPANERTEVGRLGLALNAMLAQIESAFAARAAGERRLRRFLADASHELRTPLAAIRGYAELYRIGASREPDQVDRAMSRIEAESERMGGLVDDLLTLARLDEVREGVHEPVPLDELLAEAVEDARAAAPDREISLDVIDIGHRIGGEKAITPSPVTVDANADQLRRVFDNLLRNATVHTPPGTPIELTLTAEDGQAVARVRDHGSGLPPGDPQAVFERFWRSSASRGREDGGAGLGLAIIAAIVKAHGGSVDAANPPGGGAEFTVRLPLPTRV
jgi:two-component system OmpR family sensor kinase